MNGKDGKPFKTREGGVMRLETLISETAEKMYKKISENHAIEEEEARKTANMIGVAALKYGDLQIRHQKIMFLMWTDLFHLKVIQVRIFSIRSFVLNQS